MNRKRRLLSLLTLCLIVLNFLPVYAADQDSSAVSGDTASRIEQQLVRAEESTRKEYEFLDIQRTHWAKDAIEILAQRGIIAGVGDGLFKPDSNVTRAEFVKMLTEALSFPKAKYKNQYTDVDKNAWYADAIASAYDKGIIDENMTEQDKFLPNDPITREEAAALAAAACSLGGKDEAKSTIKFDDEEEISPWAKEKVLKAASLNLITGADGSYRPKSTIKRSEAAAIILRVKETKKQNIFYVDLKNGSDENSGTEFAPFKTIDRARKAVRAVNKNMKENIYVILREGRYMLDKTLAFGDVDSGFGGFDVIYRGASGEEVSISGGRNITGWELHDAEKNIYKANAQGADTRHLFINGKRGIRARSEAGTFTNPEMDKVIGAYRTPDTYIANWKNVSDVEMYFVPKACWSERRYGVESVSVVDGEAIIKLEKRAWESAIGSGGNHAPVTLWQYENAYELLDNEGEWFLDKYTDTFYYKPLAGEDIHTADVVAPFLEELVTIYGRSYETPVHNIAFHNIGFEHAGWTYPSKFGIHSNNQSNMNNYTGNPFPGNIMVQRSNNISFTECTFSKMGTNGLLFKDGVQDVVIEGCHLYDISGSGITIGDQRYQVPDIANPPLPQQQMRGFKVNNNYIHDIGIEYFASCGSVLGFLAEGEFCHNELANMPYSGYHIGFGFGELGSTALSNVIVAKNYIHHVMQKLVDGGFIYTNGCSGGSFEKGLHFYENYCEEGGRLEIALYNDTGTDYCIWNKNVINIGTRASMGDTSSRVPECYYLNTYTTSDHMWKSDTDPDLVVHGTKLYEDANWPEEATNIIRSSGLEKKYEYLLPIDPSLSFITTESTLQLKSNDKVSVKLRGFTDRGAAYDLSNSEITYESDNPDAISIDENGIIHAKKQGMATIKTTVVEQGVTMERTTTVYVDDIFDKIKVDGMSEMLVVDAKVKLRPHGETTFGQEIKISTSFSSSDPSVLSVEQDGNVVAHKQGEATITVEGVNGDVKVSQGFLIKVVDYSDQSGLNYPEFSAENILKDVGNWHLMNSKGGIREIDGGLQFETPGGYAFYSGAKYQDELFTFDLTINTTSGWPSIGFRTKTNDLYSSVNNELYMLSFSPNTIDLQRFNAGVRTGILYSGGADFITGGPALPTVVEYGKTYRVQVGAINEENGVRIILNIDGVNVINFLDSVEGYIKDPGYLTIFCTKGMMDIVTPEKK